MKTLKLLNKRYFSIILVLFFGVNLFAEEQPVDIWNIDKKEIESNQSVTFGLEENNLEKAEETTSSIYDMQVQKKNSIELIEDLNSNKVDIIGLYDPEDNSLNINMWNNSDGDQLKRILSKLNKTSTARLSTYIYNDEKDIDKLCSALQEILGYFK